MSKPREMVNQSLLKNNQLRVSEEREPFHIEFRNAPFVTRASKRKKESAQWYCQLARVITQRGWVDRCVSQMGEKGWQKGSEATRWDPEPISWENFLTSNGQFQVEVVWTRYLRCKSSQLTIPSPCDREASWWVAHPCGRTWGGCYWHRRLTFIVYHGREKVGNLVCLSSWYDSQREKSPQETFSNIWFSALETMFIIKHAPGFIFFCLAVGQ